MSVGFGLERLGYLTLKLPRLMAAAVIALTALCVAQLPDFSIDGDLLRLFRGTGDHVQDYLKLADTFGTFENDAYVLVQSDDLTDPATIEELRFLSFELELSDFASGTLSPFSLRKPGEDGTTVPAIPEDLATREAVAQALTEQRETNPIMRNLILEDLSGMVMIMFPNAEVLEARGDAAMVESLEALAGRYQSDAFTIELTGPPFWKSELLEASRNDQFLFMFAGVFLGFLTALLTFRTFWGAVIATLTPALTALWSVGGIMLVFGTFTFLTNIVTALVLVIAFAESMYFCLYWLRLWQAGGDPHAALWETVRKVSPACALTALTTLIAFGTLALAPGQGLREFAISGGVSIALAFVALVTFLPLSILFALKLGYTTQRTPSMALTAPIPFIRRLVRTVPRPVALVAIGLALVLLIPHFLLEPRFTFQNFLPRNSESMAISSQIDEGVGGVSPLYITVPLQSSGEGMSEADFDRVDAVAAIAEDHFGEGKVISTASFEQYAEAGFSRASVLEAMGPFLRQRFIADDGSAALLTAFAPTSESAQQTMELVESLESDLQAAGFEDTLVTGFRVVSAYGSVGMITTLQQSLVLAILLSLVLIGVAFRSWKMSFVALVPNSLPILFTEFFLYSSGIQLQLTTVISLTVAYGIAVDDTIHFLTHYANARERGESARKAVDSTLDRVGPALIATTLILVAGCAVLMTSILPQVALFGLLAVITLLAALVGDLIALPAILVAGNEMARHVGDKYHEAHSQ